MRNNILILVFLCITASSCIKMKLEETYSKQETRIDDYLSKNITMQRDSIAIEKDPETGEEVEKVVKYTDTLRFVYNGGAARLVKNEGMGEELNERGAVSFYYAGYLFNGSINKSNLFVTNHSQSAAEAGWTLTDEEAKVLTINLNDHELIPGLKNGLVGVKGGEECQILFTGKYGFGKKAFGIIPANSALVYRIWVESISND